MWIYEVEKGQSQNMVAEAAHAPSQQNIGLWTGQPVVLSWMKGQSLDAVHGLELAQSLHRVDVLLLGGSLHSVGLAVVLLLSLH